MPAPKKHASTRRRRNKAPTAATLVVEPREPLEDYASWTLPKLRLEVERRNGERDFPLIPVKNTKAAYVELLTKDDDPVPEMPEHPARVRWHVQTLEWWRNAWLSPMRNEWHVDTDYFNVLIAALHFDDMMMAAGAVERQKAYNALKAAVQPLGLTPYSRRQLEWTTANAEEATRKNQRGKGQPINGAGEKPDEGKPAKKKPVDPRAHLSVVG